MGLLDQGNTSGPLLVESWKTIHPAIHSGLVHAACADRATTLSLVPSFVGNDYFCESGNPGPGYTNGRFYPNDPLWDGQGCGAASCCELSYPPRVTPPWFCKQLPQATTDDIEVRICRDQTNYEATPIELIEVYIQ